MKPINSSARMFLSLAFCIFFYQLSLAHNGKVASAYPLGNIVVDGQLSDWPGNFIKYNMLAERYADPIRNQADLDCYFQVGYRLDNHSLYLAFTVFDEDFIEDSTAGVQWNSQDGLELYLDARHLPFGSGVASFMYSKKLRNINKAFYDPFAKIANWDIMEVAIHTKENMRTYEWRIQLGDQLSIGKSIGLDATIFDKDKDGSFSFTAWGRGGSKYQTPKNLGDILIMPGVENNATITGRLSWDKPLNAKLPTEVMLTSVNNKELWLEIETDSLGNFTAMVPPGRYQVALPDAYFQTDNKIYSTKMSKPVFVEANPGRIAKTQFLVSGTSIPEPIPEKGIMHGFALADSTRVDEFIKYYQEICGIPGVSLALVKDGKLVYHKTYGVKNSITGEKVNKSTLFEAASITKPVFSFAVLRLAEKGIIDLDRPLYLYLPNKDIEHDDRYKLITAKHVLTHRTGFPNWRSMNPDGKLNLKFTPGTGYGYSGEGFEYLKVVVEKITGKPVEKVLQEEVIEPMRLYHTFFSDNDSLRKVVATGHYQMLPSNQDLPREPGMAYSMHTEAATFTRFMLYLLEQKGLKPETYEIMFKKHSDFNFDPGDEKPKFPVYMGISLEIQETPFGKSFGHGGNNGDFKCSFVVYKDLKMGYAIFTNGDSSDPLLEAMRKFLVEGKEK
jgi:CubicO group peptidase (beta-lactamase class C family)